MERLRKEFLDLSCTKYSIFIFVRELFHTKDCNDVLQLFVFLKDFLYTTCYFVMLFTYNICFKNTGCRFQWIYGRVNTLLNDLTGKNCRCIQMCECCCRCRVSQVIGRYINCLYRSNGSGCCGCDTLLQFTHLCSQSRLVTYCGRHTSKKCGYLGTCLYKTEDIINEKKDISMFCITEIFCHSKTCFRNAHTGSRRLVHLSEH